MYAALKLNVLDLLSLSRRSRLSIGAAPCRINVVAARSDGGRGLLMLGDGAGMLEVVRGAESGLTIYGEQRGSAVSDFNLDGRVDLVVTQNGALTRLYRNREAKPGLRVKVNAGPANPTGVGAQVRLVFTDGTKGTAISNAEIYIEMDNGRLEKIRRIEVQESTIVGSPSTRVVIKAESRQAIISPTFKQT